MKRFSMILAMLFFATLSAPMFASDGKTAAAQARDPHGSRPQFCGSVAELSRAVHPPAPDRPVLLERQGVVIPGGEGDDALELTGRIAGIHDLDRGDPELPPDAAVAVPQLAVVVRPPRPHGAV